MKRFRPKTNRGKPARGRPFPNYGHSLNYITVPGFTSDPIVYVSSSK